QYVDALNKGDGKAWVALFGPNPINIGPSGKTVGAEQLRSVLETNHQKGLAVTAKVEDVELLFGGQGVLAIGSYSVTYKAPQMIRQQVQGNFLFLLERSGDGWKIHASSATRSRPLPAARSRPGGLDRRGFVQLARRGSEEVLH